MLAAPAVAAPLTASFFDLAGDGNLKGDLVGATLTIDNVTGDYEVRWRATSAHPFSGDANAATNDLQLNLNLGNARLLTTAFVNTPFNVNVSTTELVVNGTAASFIGWLEGDPIVTFSDDATYPTRFGSGLVDLRVNDISDRDQLADRSVLVALGDPATLPVPVPTALANVLLGLALLGLARGRRRWPAARSVGT